MFLMKYLFSILLVLGLFSSQGKPAYGADRVILIDGEISNGSMRPILDYMNELIAAPIAPEKLHIILNSPGGSVVTGFLFLDRLNALKAKGTRVICNVAEVAASMAFQILVNCDERYAMDTSFLLWHRARVFLGGMMGAAMTGPELYAMGVQLKDLDEHIYRDVRNAMPDAPEHYISFHFEKETLHTGANLNKAVPSFISLDPDLAWTMTQLSSTSSVRTARGSIFDTLRFGDLIYVWDRVLVGRE